MVPILVDDAEQRLQRCVAKSSLDAELIFCATVFQGDENDVAINYTAGLWIPPEMNEVAVESIVQQLVRDLVWCVTRDVKRVTWTKVKKVIITMIQKRVKEKTEVQTFGIFYENIYYENDWEEGNKIWLTYRHWGKETF
jgi:hypothetical protein